MLCISLDPLYPIIEAAKEPSGLNALYGTSFKIILKVRLAGEKKKKIPQRNVTVPLVSKVFVPLAFQNNFVIV
jgi:hypothetical protein